ncbi:glycoside hydrolase family protein [Cohnella rhizosphaerae]|uniref:Glycosyl hydrolase family 32 N-terminal domain-containing protein n=1 Tax=Cohnella rhizosphaerae TaxID=1457232 RepID=A0A9X4L2A5_9BACL|nr:hypothetical protein [Cohnella rhizosphaerae]MDG0812227.1 hypothetical protein [Cohnella rhizosphaerae]
MASPMSNRYVMYYSIVTRNDITGISFEQLALAVSTDGITWSKAGPAVVIPHGTVNDWDYRYATVGANVLKLSDNLYKLWYSGGNTQSYEGIGCATSTDGLNWVKNATNPILYYFNGVAWRNMRTYNPWALFDPARFNGHGDAVCYKFWFTGSPKTTDKKKHRLRAQRYRRIMMQKKTSRPGESAGPACFSFLLRLSREKQIFHHRHQAVTHPDELLDRFGAEHLALAHPTQAADHLMRLIHLDNFVGVNHVPVVNAHPVEQILGLGQQLLVDVGVHDSINLSLSLLSIRSSLRVCTVLMFINLASAI